MADPIQLTGKSGRIYQFQLDRRGLEYRDTPGVYVLGHGQNYPVWEIIYAGAAVSLQHTLDTRSGVLDWGRIAQLGVTGTATYACPIDEARAIATDLFSDDGLP